MNYYSFKMFILGNFFPFFIFLGLLIYSVQKNQKTLKVEKIICQEERAVKVLQVVQGLSLDAEK